MTLRRIDRGRAVERVALAPDLGDSLGQSVSVVGLPANGASVLGGRLQPGSSVRLLIPRRERRGCIDAVVLLVRREPSSPKAPYTVVVAVRQEAAQEDGRLISSTGTVVVGDTASCPHT
jgi:hypothetical protein